MKSEDSTQQWHTPYSYPVTFCLVKFSTKFMFSHYQALQNSIHFPFWWAYFQGSLFSEVLIIGGNFEFQNRLDYTNKTA